MCVYVAVGSAADLEYAVYGEVNVYAGEYVDTIVNNDAHVDCVVDCVLAGDIY